MPRCPDRTGARLHLLQLQRHLQGVYARTGVVLWGGDRGTSWQVQGGLNFRF